MPKAMMNPSQGFSELRAVMKPPSEIMMVKTMYIVVFNMFKNTNINSNIQVFLVVNPEFLDFLTVYITRFYSGLYPNNHAIPGFRWSFFFPADKTL